MLSFVHSTLARDIDWLASAHPPYEEDDLKSSQSAWRSTEPVLGLSRPERFPIPYSHVIVNNNQGRMIYRYNTLSGFTGRI